MDPLVFPRLQDGIGNRFFQLYTAKFYSELFRIPMAIIPSLCGTQHGSAEDFFALFPDLTYLDAAPKHTTVEQELEDAFVYKLWDPPPPNTSIMLKGAYQAAAYCNHTNLFPNWRNALKENAEMILNRADLNTYEKQKRTWMIHFRYGDYKKLPHHQIPLSKYYTLCIYEIPKGHRLHVFSDEPELCREFVEGIAEERGLILTFSKETRDIAALYEMQNCLGGSIVANSSFSWWGAFFARKRALEIGHTMKYYYPASWGQGLGNPKDLIPEWGTKVLLD
jgi:hypothetical protein